MNDVATTTPRLPVPAGMDVEYWKVLTEAIFPSAREPRSIMLALAYCKARNLDVLKKPVNIVPIWNSDLGRNVEGLWPSINEIEVTASRTKEWAGMDDPRWGPEITETFEGRRKDRKQGWVDVSCELTYPEWCSVTVYRMVNGTRCAFSEPVYWKEAYGRTAGTAYPNDMWQKRPKGQLLKVAKAFSLRAAFPEEGAGPTDAEMEGQTVEPAPEPPKPADNWRPPQNIEGPGKPDMENVDQHQKASLDRAGAGEDAPRDPHDAGDVIDRETGEVISETMKAPHAIAHLKDEPWRDWCSRLMKFVRDETELEVVEQWVVKNKQMIAALMADAPKVHSQLQSAIGKHRGEILRQQNEGSPE